MPPTADGEIRCGGEDIEESGSIAAALHRGWISLADAVTGDDPHAILAAAEAGEDHAVSEYDDALADTSLSGELRDIVTLKAGEVAAPTMRFALLRDSFDS